MTGSSYRLKVECERLAETLRLPLDTPLESVRRMVPPEVISPEAPLWHRYLAETAVCLALHTACRISLASGSAIAFC